MHVQITEIDETARRIIATLDQEPLAEGAVLALDNRTGQVLAMVGGYDFERSKFNRAVQASRQLGSLFKAVLYATAIDRGYTPTSIIVDEPVSYPAGPDQPDYTPRNYDQEFVGPVTLRHALREISQRAGGARHGRARTRTRRRVCQAPGGSPSELPPFLSVALGAAEATLLEVTSAYTVFPNQGVRFEPYHILRITDRDGNVLEDNRPVSHDALPADTAYVMTSLLRGVVERGTGIQAAAIPWPLAGKTGTVDDYTDGWFVGFDPDFTVGVWVGHDEKKTLGPAEERGNRGAADLARCPCARTSVSAPTRRRFRRRPTSCFCPSTGYTGHIADPAAPDTIREAFIAGTEPGSAFQQH